MTKTVEEVRRELFRNVCARLDKDPGYDTESGYSSPYGNEAWLVLNAALDAVEIELPKPAHPPSLTETGLLLDKQEAVTILKCRAAIEQTGLGLKIK